MLLARTSFSPLSLESSAGEKVCKLCNFFNWIGKTGRTAPGNQILHLRNPVNQRRIGSFTACTGILSGNIQLANLLSGFVTGQIAVAKAIVTAAEP